MEFFERVEKLITGNDARRFAVFTIDLDKFKEINDLQGHLIGDQLLQRVAGAVLKTLQKEEMVARFGGDEFVAVKPFADESEWTPLPPVSGTASAVSRRLPRRK
ncbi:sensory box/GGDEF family protein [Klebsiella quasipneumoniae]|nr:sensory box/GGDEF family protein [Klebsiella quasipneumoniae]